MNNEQFTSSSDGKNVMLTCRNSMRDTATNIASDHTRKLSTDQLKIDTQDMLLSEPHGNFVNFASTITPRKCLCPYSFFTINPKLLDEKLPVAYFLSLFLA